MRISDWSSDVCSSDLAFNMHTILVAIEFDPDKAQANLRKHRASFAHAEQSLRDEHAITVADPDSEGEPRLVTLGMDALGRILVVVHTPRGEIGSASCRERVCQYV